MIYIFNSVESREKEREGGREVQRKRRSKKNRAQQKIENLMDKAWERTRKMDRTLFCLMDSKMYNNVSDLKRNESD